MIYINRTFELFVLEMGQLTNVSPCDRFVSLKKASNEIQFRSAAASVAIELSLLHELKKPLSLACDVPRHDERIWQMIRRCRISEGSLRFHNKEEKETLFFVFNQLGETPEVQTEATVEATEQPEAEAVVEDELEVEEVEEAVESAEPHGIVAAVYSHALEAKKAPKHDGYLDFSLADPAVKFAVSYSHLLIYFINTNHQPVLQTLLPNNRSPYARHLRLQGPNRRRRNRTRRKDLPPPQEACARTP